jgi:hypothetical protein
MKELQDRLVAYITKCNGLVSLDKLISVATGVGFSESEVLQALDCIGKKLKANVRGNQVYYQIAPIPKTPTDHLKWVREHYPDNSLTDYGQPIPFYDPEYDGPTHIYSKETDKFYREKNEALKRKVDSEKFQRPVVYDRKRYG